MMVEPLVSLRVVTLAPVPAPLSRPMSYVVVSVHCTEIVDVASTLAVSTPWVPKVRFEALLITHCAWIVTSTVNVVEVCDAYALPPTSESPATMHGTILRILFPLQAYPLR